MAETAKRTLEEEQAAFNAQLPELITGHEGEYVLFQGGRPVQFFDTHEAAYAAGLDRFGLDVIFLVWEVAKPQLHPVSVSWDAGVMFG
jgi:hypothetical protein